MKKQRFIKEKGRISTLVIDERTEIFIDTTSLLAFDCDSSLCDVVKDRLTNKELAEINGFILTTPTSKKNPIKRYINTRMFRASDGSKRKLFFGYGPISKAQKYLQIWISGGDMDSGFSALRKILGEELYAEVIYDSHITRLDMALDYNYYFKHHDVRQIGATKSDHKVVDGRTVVKFSGSPFGNSSRIYSNRVKPKHAVRPFENRLEVQFRARKREGINVLDLSNKNMSMAIVKIHNTDLIPRCELLTKKFHRQMREKGISRAIEKLKNRETKHIVSERERDNVRRSLARKIEKLMSGSEVQIFDSHETAFYESQAALKELENSAKKYLAH